MGHYQDRFNERLILTDKAHYHREQYQSFMTGPEWRNVEMAQEFAQFLKEGHSMFQFPWFRQTWDLWKVVNRSWSAARRYNRFSDVLFSEYMMMDLFVAVFTTIEFSFKGIVSLLLYPFLKKNNHTPLQNHLAEYHARYAQKLETVPFYAHDYHAERKTLNDAYRAAPNRTWGDWFSFTFISIELFARHWVSKPLNWWFTQEDNAAPPTTDVIVKFRAKEATDTLSAKQAFRNIIQDEKSQIGAEIVGDDIYVKAPNTQKGKTYFTVYARLRAPRYLAFQQTVRHLGEAGIELRKIAGNDRVQVKCSLKANGKKAMQETQTRLSRAAGTQAPLYTYGDRLHQNRRFCLFDVPVKNLHDTLSAFDTCSDPEHQTKVEFIHNF